MEPSDTHVPLLDVDPSVRYAVAEGGQLSVVPDFEAVHEDAYCDEIPVGQRGRYGKDLGRHGDSRESGHKVLDGHGRQHVVARDVHVSVRGGGGDGTYQAALVVDAYKPVL